MPAADNYVMFDLESPPPRLDELDTVHLWDTQVFGADPVDYQAAVAGFALDEDRRRWLDLLEQSGAIFEAYGNMPANICEAVSSGVGNAP